MDAYRAIVLLHLLTGIALVGLGLFWFIMLAALRRHHSAEECDRLLGVAAGARWPHVVVPYRLRLPLPWLNWAVVALVAATGAVAVVMRGGAPVNASWTVKLVLSGLLLVGLGLLVRRPSAMVIRLNLAVLLAVIVLSAISLRS
jgi:hypothetical protein